MFKTIDKNISAVIVEKKSKFIANLFYVESQEEANKLIEKTRKKYFDARHNCYAYSIMTENGVVNKFSDDGEPSGTAGSPMLKILSSQNLSNILVIVTRYFGGILLGTGGLVRAYSQATVEALNNSTIIEKELGIEAILEINYSDLEKLKYYLAQNSINIVNIEYGEIIKLTIQGADGKIKNIEDTNKELNFNILKLERIGEKYITLNYD